MGQMLGKKNEFWSVKLSGMIKIFNNAALAQFRNVSERKVKMLKQLLKMGIIRKLGPQTKGVRIEIYQTIFEQTVHALNTTPYLMQGNFRVLTSGLFINPWLTSKVSVRELPEHNIKALRQVRNVLVNQMIVINNQLKEEMCMEVERWKQGQLRLSNNKSS